MEMGRIHSRRDASEASRPVTRTRPIRMRIAVIMRVGGYAMVRALIFPW